jgi:ADP-ribose pyrophosphatase
MSDPALKTDGIDLIERATVFKGYFRMDRYTLRHRRFDGTWSNVMTREVFERGRAAVVLPYDPVRDEVGLLEQFRAGALSAGWHPWLIETVAGIIDAGETAEETAIRETREEAGLDVSDLVPICEVINTPGGSSETCSLFCARVDATRIGGLHGMPEEDEDIRLFTLTTDEALDWIAQGRIKNATTVIALQWLALNKEKLRKRWGG